MQISSSPADGDNSKNTFFFDNQARAALRHDIMAALIDDAPFLVLTGPGGSGKTTLISRLVATLPNGIEGIMVSQTSYDCRRFDDMLVRLCQHIALEPPWKVHPDAGDITRIQEAIRHYLTQKRTRLLLILDQGEQAFPAMLERIWQMVDAVNDGGLIMHLLLVGRENLLTDLKLLRLTHVSEIPERYFILPLLKDDDLPDFRRQWLANAGPDIQKDALSRRALQTLCAEVGGRPGRLAALLDEKFDALTSDPTDRRLYGPDKTGKTKPSRARWEQKMLAGFSLTALLERLEDVLLTPPRRHSQHPISDRQRRAAPPVMTRRDFTRLRRKSILFWGKLYRQIERLRKRIVLTMATVYRASAPVMGKAARGIAQTATSLFSAAANRPWAKIRQFPAHRSAIPGKTITAKFPALPSGVLKKFALVLVAVWFAVIGAAALWQGLSHVSPPGKNKQGETQSLTEKASQAPANPGDENILSGENPAGQAGEEGQEIISGPAAAGIPAAATAVAPKAAVKPEPRPAAMAVKDKTLKRPAHSRENREPAKITAGKKKKKAAPEAKLKRPAHSQDKREAAKITTGKKNKKAAPEAKKPTHIPRGKTAEKAKR